MMLRSLALAALAPVLVLGAAVSPRASKVTTLASNVIDGLAPLAAFAAAGYCRANDTAIWKCGSNCDAVKDFIPTATGGDGTFSQYWYVGYYGPLDTVVVSHQGTRKKSVLPILVDINIFLEEPDNSIFPGLANAGVRMHNGFHDAHVEVFPDVLAAVKKTMAQRKTKNILLVGHSLGGALSVFDAIALKFVLPKDTNYKIVTFGQPRLGNQAFASYVDKVFGGSIVRMTNKKDPVPTLPGRFLGFAHYQGEVHIRSKDDAVVICSGSDSEDKDCSIDEVPNIFVSDVNQHKGPYVGQIMKCFDNEGTQVRSLDDDDNAEDYY